MTGVAAKGTFPGVPFPLAASSEMLFLNLPQQERAAQIDAAGFLVEIWDWTRHDIDALASSGVTFSSMTGYVRGRLGDPDGSQELVETAKESIAVARRLRVPRLNLHGTGLGPDGLPLLPATEVTGGMWLHARDTLRRLADLGDEAGVTFVLENLNAAVDHPGVPFGRAIDCIELVASVDRTAIRLMLDLYHAQIGEGNLVELCRQALPYIGEIQVADVPGRCEPGTGEINYPFIARELFSMGYRGPVGLESWASTDSLAALTSFRMAFTIQPAESFSAAESF